MDAATLISLIVSAASLVAAAYVGIRQYTIQKNSNSLPATWELLAQWQKPELIEAFDFIMRELDDQDPDEGLTGLPSEARAKVLNVAYFLQHVALLIILDIIDERSFTTFLRARVVSAWEKAGPFILAERALNPAAGPEFMSLLEAWAAKAKLYSPEIGQQILAKWLAQDRRHIGPNMIERIAGRRRIWEKEYLEAMGRSLTSESKSETNHGQAGDSNGAANSLPE
jgi:hypothetical protein